MLGRRFRRLLSRDLGCCSDLSRLQIQAPVCWCLVNHFLSWNSQLCPGARDTPDDARDASSPPHHHSTPPRKNKNVTFNSPVCAWRRRYVSAVHVLPMCVCSSCLTYVCGVLFVSRQILISTVGHWDSSSYGRRRHWTSIAGLASSVHGSWVGQIKKKIKGKYSINTNT